MDRDEGRRFCSPPALFAGGHLPDGPITNGRNLPEMRTYHLCESSQAASHASMRWGRSILHISRRARVRLFWRRCACASEGVPDLSVGYFKSCLNRCHGTKNWGCGSIRNADILRLEVRLRSFDETQHGSLAKPFGGSLRKCGIV